MDNNEVVTEEVAAVVVQVFLCLVNQFLCLLHVLSLQWGSC